MKKNLFLTLALMMSLVTMAQVTTHPSPIPVGYQDSVVITFDPNGGNAGMKGATKCYCHTGVLTQKSKSSSDWKYVVGSWRGATQPQLTATQDGKWQLVIQNLDSFYNIAAGDTIKSLCFVFHDGPSGSKEGKTSTGGDIIITLGEEGSGDIWEGFVPAAVTEQTRPAAVSNGIYYNQDGSVTLCTYAASKTQPALHVFLLGDMTNWKLDNNYQLKRDGNYFWITLTGLQQKEYRFQYAVMRADSTKKQISDLYSEKVLIGDDQYEPSGVDPALLSYPLKGADGGYVSVIEPGRSHFDYNWQNTTFQRPNKNNLIIYEAWVYDYTPERCLSGMMKRLDYLGKLGVNAIELMPVCEFDGNINWGYSPNHYFALDKAYGTPGQFKQFVDSCHGRGIAVILDMVFNHATGLNPMNKLYDGSDLKYNPWFNVTAPHSDNVYEDWNHGFAPASEMFTRALQYWQSEYHVDGFRMDLSHGFCDTVANTSVKHITEYYNKAIAPNNAYFILEHWGSNMGSERPQLVNLGCMCWNSSIKKAAYQTAMGWLTDGDDFTDANQKNYVDYTCSHDEERPFYKAKTWGNGAISSDSTVRNSRIAANLVLDLLLNGPHMIWQYEELGYDFSINSYRDNPTYSTDDAHKCDIKPRPEDYGYFSAGTRMQQYARVAKAVQLRTRLMPTVFAGTPTDKKLTTGNALRYVQWGDSLYVIANYGTGNQPFVLPSGTWYDYLDGGGRASSGTQILNQGQVKVFTGKPVVAPTIPTSYDFGTGLEEVTVIAGVRTQKYIKNGQVLIGRNGQVYDILGRKIW